MWYRKEDRNKRQDLNKYCFDCHNPMPIWFDKECPYCEKVLKKDKIRGLRPRTITFDEYTPD